MGETMDYRSEIGAKIFKLLKKVKMEDRYSSYANNGEKNNQNIFQNKFLAQVITLKNEPAKGEINELESSLRNSSRKT